MNLKAPKGIDVESWFIECYRKHKGNPMQILLGLYKGNYHKFFLAVIFFFIKHAPVWVLPIVTANIINDITSGSPETYQNIMIQAVIMVFLVILNVPIYINIILIIGVNISHNIINSFIYFLSVIAVYVMR